MKPFYRVGLAAFALAAPAAVAVMLARRRFAMVTVDGLSMLPTLKAGDRVLVRRTGVGQLRRGQLAVAAEDGRHADGSREWVIKRVAAVPGDPRPTCLPDTADPASRVPDGHYVLLGDNAAISYDSRQRGYFTAGQLLGVVVRGPVDPGLISPCDGGGRVQAKEIGDHRIPATERYRPPGRSARTRAWRRKTP